MFKVYVTISKNYIGLLLKGYLNNYSTNPEFKGIQILFRFIISSFLSPYILKDQQVLRRHQKPLPNINNIFAIAIALNKLFLLKMRHIPHLVMKRSTNITSSSYAHQNPCNIYNHAGCRFLN